MFSSLDTAVASLLPKSGGTMTGIINHGGNRATNIATPTANTDAATKQYVDGKVGAIPDLSSLLTGGSIRKIYGGFSRTYPNENYAVTEGGLVLNDTIALFAAKKLSSDQQAFFVVPEGDSGISDTQGFLLYPYRNYNGAVVSTPIEGGYWNWYKNMTDSVTINGTRHTVFYINHYLPATIIGLAVFYSPSGFVYAD